MVALVGAGVAAGQAPWELWYIALPAFAVLTAIVARETDPLRTVWLGWIGGAGYFAATLFWIVEPFFVDVARHGWMAPFALLLMAFGMALFWGLAAWVASLGRGPGLRALGFALGLVATDLARGYVFTGFPWALLGHVWIGTPVMQAAAWVGPVGLSLAFAVPAALPMLGRRVLPRFALGFVGAAVIGALWWAGTERLAAPEPPGDPSIRVRLIQPNAAQALKWRGDMWRIFLERQMEQTALPAEKPLDLIIWPESAIPFLLERSGALFEDIARASGGVPMAAGIQRAEDLRYFNSLAFADGSGRITEVYDKWHLVPFGEYVPFGDLFARVGIAAFAAQAGNSYSAGPGARIVDLGPLGKVLPLICYEAVFPQDLNAAEGRADWILQVTNDGWFGNVAGPYQHFAQARLRAVEQGLPLLRAANTGITAVIDAKGRVHQSLALNTQGVIDADLPAALPPTPYVRTGDVPATIFVAVALLALGLGRRRISD
ncbi:apolipoprotein N-acyltransferase [Albidovulum aquaemixtae]|uniref:apolipoprotein N-acyltransferase n=1 Tax=Albidovulum aquaemixtae TaxID=1542388 RepID=UPI002795FC2A|nr:apolipoprotein N-acyltransferase [Defluviimonas aquaemixtae]